MESVTSVAPEELQCTGASGRGPDRRLETIVRLPWPQRPGSVTILEKKRIAL